MHRLACTSVLILIATTDIAAQTLEALRRGEVHHGFRAEALYRGPEERAVGARLVHESTGFTLDLLRVETAPQAYVWIDTYLVSDMGEPHTQEHLLLGKGNVGRGVANLESFSLVSSSAFVTQRRTQYHFNSPAGTDVFYEVLEAQLEALLFPDYTDEEIRREVRNIGVAVDPDGTMRLEEKGTVYSEMVTSFERPGTNLFRVAGQALYGEDHPLAMSAGGWPEAIRRMTPEDIRRYHRATHHPGNMGMIAALPRSEPLERVLPRVAEMIEALGGRAGAPPGPFTREEDLPAPRWLSAEEIRSAEYPHRNAEQPSPIVFAWRPERSLSAEEEVLLGLFLANFAGDPTTNLYRIFVESASREIDLGATGVSGWVGSEQGHPVYLQLLDVAPGRATPARLAEARDRILDELRTIAGWPGGSPELAEFNRRLRSRILEARRDMSYFASAPPGFGQRGTGDRWVSLLHRLARSGEYERHVTLAPELDAIEAWLDDGENGWRQRLDGWGLVEVTPHTIAARPSPGLVEREERERRQRLDAELQRLVERFGVEDPQEAIRRYAAEYDAESARLQELESATGGRFLTNPPRGLDEPLDFRIVDVEPGVPVVWSRFEGFAAATAGLALRLDAVPDDELMYLAVLPALLTQSGVIRGGVPMPYAEMRDRLRQEILSLSAYYSTHPHRGRLELVIRGAGNNAAEAAAATRWMADALYHPDWRIENVARVRDVVDQGLAALRGTTARSEEAWVEDPASAYRFQADPLYLSIASFQTRTHAAMRLRWQLREVSEGDRVPIETALADLAGRASGLPRAELPDLLRDLERAGESLSPAGAEIVREIVRDLELTLGEVPDDALAVDLEWLAGTIARDLRLPPAQALAALHRVRERLLHRATARSFLISSPETGEALQPALGSLFAGLRADAPPAVERRRVPIVHERLRERDPSAEEILFVGLVNPNTQGGVFLNSAPLAGYRDRNPDAIFNFLAAQLYSGGGAHSVFMKTWAAGLAYSNGLRSSPSTGLLGYYAERTPELPQTLRFVIEELRASPLDPGLAEYAVAMAFRGVRSAHPYESRGEAMANDLADGIDPHTVARFLDAVLEVRRRANLPDELFRRMEAVYGRVLPGYGDPSRGVADAVFFVIGPDTQLRLYEEYLRRAEGPDARLHRLFPRDFWIVE